eukprot:gene5842-8947_t
MAEPEEPEEGTGCYAFEDGSLYEGAWILTGEPGAEKVLKRHGKGKMTEFGNVYDGNWVNDAMEGAGIFTLENGATYSGVWARNKYEGKGKYTWPDGSFYDGSWRAGLMHGEGVYRDASGKNWHGRFYNGSGPEAKDEPNAEHRREMERRVDMLKQQKKMVLDKLSGLTGGSNSSNILDALKKAVGADRSREEEANNEDMFDDRDDATLLDMQNDAIVQQDAALARLSNVISKQKMVGQAIMGELDSQNEVLEMVEEGVTASTGAVRNETKRVGKLVDATSKDNKVTL